LEVRTPDDEFGSRRFYFYLSLKRTDVVWKDILLGLDVLLELVVSWTLLAPVADDDGGAANDLPGLALGVELAKAGPLSQLLVVVNLDERDLEAKSNRYRARLASHLKQTTIKW
jgi:hypothetical protein